MRSYNIGLIGERGLCKGRWLPIVSLVAKNGKVKINLLGPEEGSLRPHERASESKNEVAPIEVTEWRLSVMIGPP